MNLTAEQDEIIKNILPGAVIMLLISLFGFFGNATIVASTIRSKKLNSKCNTLIAMLAAADFITQLSHLPYVYFVLTGTLVKPLDFCFYIMSPSLISMNFGTSLIWMIGLDRLLSVMYPMIYITWRKLPYLLVMISPGLVYCILFIVLGWEAASDEPMLCFIPEAYGPPAKNAWVGSTVLFNAFVVITYAYLIKVVNRNKEIASRSASAEDKNRRLLKAILIIMLFEVFGWFLNMSILGTAIAVGSSFETIFYIEVYAGAVLNIGIACNFYVYYYNSFEYRKAFKLVLCFWRKGQMENGRKNNAVSLGGGFRTGTPSTPLASSLHYV